MSSGVKWAHSLLLFVFGNLRRQLCFLLQRAITPFSFLFFFSEEDGILKYRSLVIWAFVTRRTQTLSSSLQASLNISSLWQPTSSMHLWCHVTTWISARPGPFPDTPWERLCFGGSKVCFSFSNLCCAKRAIAIAPCQLTMLKFWSDRVHISALRYGSITKGIIILHIFFSRQEKWSLTVKGPELLFSRFP